MKAQISLSNKVMKVRMSPRKQSGVIAFKVTNKMNVKFLLIRKTGSNKWGFPKGKVESHLTKKQSALVEAHEEGGVSGKIVKPIGRYRYIKNKTKRVQLVDLFLMEVTKTHKDYLEIARERRWFTYKDALKVLSKEQMPFMVLAGNYIEQEEGLLL